MSYNIVSIPQFDKDLKKLAKKYRSIKDDVKQLGELLAENPTTGDMVMKNCYKIRIAIDSKGKGKSEGAREDGFFHVDLMKLIYLEKIFFIFFILNNPSQKYSILPNKTRTNQIVYEV